MSLLGDVALICDLLSAIADAVGKVEHNIKQCQSLHLRIMLVEPVLMKLRDGNQPGVKEFVARRKHTLNDDHLPLNQIASIPTCDEIDFDNLIRAL